MTTPLANRRTLLKAAVAATALLGLTAKGYAMPTSQGPVTGYAPSAGLQVYFEIHGPPLTAGATPVVLLHPGIMSIETAFAKGLLPALAGERTVIAIEQQGHGRTGDRPGPASIDQMVEDTAAVLDHLNVRQAHLVGHSLGGIIALGMAIRHPARVRTLTPISSFSNLDGMLPGLAAMQRDPSQPPAPEILPLLPTEADFASWQESFLRLAPAPGAFEAILGKMNVMLGSWPGWDDADIGRIAAPTRIVIGDNDFVRIEHAADMKRRIAGADLAILPRTTHMSILGQPALLTQLMEPLWVDNP